MTDAHLGSRDASGNWRPTQPISPPPIIAWPPRLEATARWLFGFPGYLWPMNSLWLAISVVTWMFLTPDLAAMKTLGPWWIGLLFARNLAFLLLFFGGLHIYFNVLKGQGDDLKLSTEPFATNNQRFLFRDQVRDNMVRSLAFGTPIITAYEALTYYLFANGYLGFIGLEGGSFWFWAWFVLLLLFAPVIHAVHFYFTHRLLHWKPLYRSVHYVHHLNVEVGPWSGLAMHPVELAIYFSTVVVQWLLALHPVNALYQIHIAMFSPALGHCGFEKLLVGRNLGVDNGNYFHYLHHKYFECNYGGSLAPLDRVFGTFHDGSKDVHVAMRQRMRARRGL